MPLSEQHTVPLNDLRSSIDALEFDHHAPRGEKLDGSDGDDASLNEHEFLMQEGSEKQVQAEIEDESNSPAAMVRKVVPETDDPSLPTLTFRVFSLGLLFCILGSSISQLMFFKSNPVAFSSYFVILITLPLGRLMEYYLPIDVFRFCGLQFTLNPGPFNAKEHMLIAVIAGSGSVAAYAGDVIVVQDLFYHTDLGLVGGILLLLTTQLIGFGLAGLLYDLLVRPTVMVWPAQLVTVTLFNTLHGGGDLTRRQLRFFAFAFSICFVWQFLPAVYAPLLTSFAVLCLLGRGSSVARVLGSGYQGLGILNLSFDWSVISSAGSLYTPFWANANFFGGIILQCWVLTPLTYFVWNTWNSRSFDSPIAPALYNRHFERFNVSAVITPELTLDEAAYSERGPILLTPFFAITYGGCFAILTAAIVTVALWHYQTVRDAFSKAHRASPDIHVSMLERHYEGVPARWYAMMLVSMLSGGIYCCLFYPIQLPVWCLFLAISISAFFLVPCGIIAATTNTMIGLNVITELVAGFLLPGKPIGNVVFKCWGYMTMSQALGLVGDLKLALYSKIPPKHMFICQSLGTAVGSVVNYATLKRVIADKRPYLDGTLTDPTGQWTGRSPGIFYSASIIWGLIGPARFFGGQYKVLYLGFLIGAVVPVIPWYIAKRRPDWRRKFSLHRVSFPLIFSGAVAPPQIPTNIIICGFLSAYLSQYWALRKHPRWHAKYNNVLSAALDAATSVNALVVYALGLQALSSSFWNNPIDTEHCKRS